MSKHRDGHVNVPVTTASLFAVFFAVTGAAIAVGGTRIAGITGAQDETAPPPPPPPPLDASLLGAPPDAASPPPPSFFGDGGKMGPGGTGPGSFPPPSGDMGMSGGPFGPGGMPGGPGGQGFPGGLWQGGPMGPGGDFRGPGPMGPGGDWRGEWQPGPGGPMGPGGPGGDWRGGPGDRGMPGGPGGQGFPGGLWQGGPMGPGGDWGRGHPAPEEDGEGDDWMRDDQQGPECYFAEKDKRGGYTCSEGGWWTERFGRGKAVCVNGRVSEDECGRRLGLKEEEWRGDDWDRGRWDEGNWKEDEWRDEDEGEFGDDYPYSCEPPASDGTCGDGLISESMDGKGVCIADTPARWEDKWECACELYGGRLCRWGGEFEGPDANLPSAEDVWEDVSGRPSVMRLLEREYGITEFDQFVEKWPGIFWELKGWEERDRQEPRPWEEEESFGPTMRGAPGPEFGPPIGPPGPPPFEIDESTVQKLGGMLGGAIPMLIGMATQSDLPSTARQAITTAIEVVQETVASIPTLIEEDDDAAIIAAMQEVQTAIENVMRAMMGGRLIAGVVEKIGAMLDVAEQAFTLFREYDPETIGELDEELREMKALHAEVVAEIEAGETLQAVKGKVVKIVRVTSGWKSAIDLLAQMGVIPPEVLKRAEELFASIGGPGGPPPPPYPGPMPMPMPPVEKGQVF